MPRSRRHHGEDGLESADDGLSADRLSADRLADLVGALRASASSDSATRLLRGAPQEPSAAESQQAPEVTDQAASGGVATDKVAPGRKSGRSVPTRADRASSAAAAGSASRASAPAAPGGGPSSAKGLAPEALTNTPTTTGFPWAGRHRRAPTARLMVRGFALTTYRLALMGALALLLVAAAILKSLS